VLVARACLMSSTWRRSEYLGGAHLPDDGFLCGMNGLRSVATPPLPLPPLVLLVERSGDNFGFVAAAVGDVNKCF
jgi:hypothetical protein